MELTKLYALVCIVCASCSNESKAQLPATAQSPQPSASIQSPPPPATAQSLQCRATAQSPQPPATTQSPQPPATAQSPTAVAPSMCVTSKPTAAQIAVVVAQNLNEPSRFRATIERRLPRIQEQVGVIRWSLSYDNIPMLDDVISVKVGDCPGLASNRNANKSYWEVRRHRTLHPLVPPKRSLIISDAQAREAAGLPTASTRLVYRPQLIFDPAKPYPRTAQEVEHVVDHYDLAFEVISGTDGAFVDAYTGKVIGRFSLAIQ